MKKIFSFILAVIFLLGTSKICVFAEEENLIPIAESTMQEGSAWGSKYGGSVSYVSATLNNDENNTVLSFTRENGKSQSWHSPTLNLVKYLEDDTKKNGGGTYKTEFDVSALDDAQNIYMGIKFRSDKTSSFKTEASGDNSEFRTDLGSIKLEKSEAWYHVKCFFSCDSSDFKEMTSMLFCFDGLKDTTTKIYVDNFSIVRTSNEQNGITKAVFSEINGSVAEKTETKTNVIENTKNEIKREETELGINLLSEANSYFEVNNVSKSGWNKMGSCQIELDDSGISGKCLIATEIQNSWSSPTFDISQYITKPGKYSFGMYVQTESEDDSQNQVAVLVRGKNENSFITKHNGNCYSDAFKFNITSGLWVYMCFEIDVTEEDISKKGKKDTWEVCLSGIPDNTKTIRIDNAELVFGTKDMLSKDGDEKIAEANAEINKAIAEKRSKNQQKVTFDESFYSSLKITAILTVIIVAAVIFIKVRKAKK